jgi:hypothetical protein
MLVALCICAEKGNVHMENRKYVHFIVYNTLKMYKDHNIHNYHTILCYDQPGLMSSSKEGFVFFKPFNKDHGTVTLQ